MFDYELEIINEISECYHHCDFFSSDMDGMFCSHPKFKGLPWQDHIINQENSRGRVPDECPLRGESETKIVKIYKLKII